MTSPAQMVPIPIELIEEVKRWNPGCVTPESYGPNMYGLAQAIVAVLDAAREVEHE